MKNENNHASDIPRKDWVEKLLPSHIQPYIRLSRIDRPTGAWLLLFPCWWSVALAIKDWNNITELLNLFILFLFGAIIMRAAGCCLNDIFDHKLDANVARTSNRPIAAKLITVKQASIFMISLCGLGLIILLQFNKLTIYFGLASIILVIIYPLTKRFTYWPQLILGFTFNWGALLGWIATAGELQAPAVVLYAAGIFWTLGYDTIYALQDINDDAKVGIKSLALKFQNNIHLFLCFVFTITIILMLMAGYMVNLHWLFYFGIGITAIHAIWQVCTININDPLDCLKKFKSNHVFSWLFLLSIIFGKISI